MVESFSIVKVATCQGPESTELLIPETYQNSSSQGIDSRSPARSVFPGNQFRLVECRLGDVRQSSESIDWVSSLYGKVFEMKFVRNLSMLVLLACVSLSVGCTPASESTGTSGSSTATPPAAGGEEAGSGVAGGSPAPATP